MSAPGWYPDPNGQAYQRWWDGEKWTEQTQQTATAAVAYGQQVGGLSSESRQWALFAHLSGLLLGFIGPLIIYLVKKDEDPFVADQGREALNFNLTILLVILISIPLTLVIVGIFTLIAAGIVGFIFQILAAIEANKGVWYRYPITIRFLGA